MEYGEYTFGKDTQNKEVDIIYCCAEHQKECLKWLEGGTICE